LYNFGGQKVRTRVRRSNWIWDDGKQMSVTDLDSTLQIDAKLGGSFHRRKIAYSIMDYHHSLYINKKDIILGQIHACDLLYKYTIEDLDKKVLKKEILDLKLMLDLIE
jgi:hypothetical protein